MSRDNHILLTSEEIDILQEIMNIAFGKASAELAEVIDVTVILSVPEVRLINSDMLRDYVMQHLSFADNLSLVMQDFFGRIKGAVLLGFPSGAENAILKLMEGDDSANGTHECCPSTLGQEAILEIGNILIGACIGKLSELLQDYVTYSPPKLVVEDYRKLAGSDILASADTIGITMKTMFSFEEDLSVTGYLFILTEESTLEWLKTALHAYLDSFDA